MKKYTALVGWVLILGVWGGWWVVAQIHAQSTDPGGQIDAFTYFIPFKTDRLDDQFNIGQSTSNLIDVDIETIISIAVHRNGSVIYYDQWEDGLEPNLTQPTQFSTLVWGDGDPTNNNTNLAPGVQVTGIPANDVLTNGTVIILRNVVILPRDQAQLFFDGGDTFTSIGGAIAVSLTFWTFPRPPNPGILFADAWELYPTDRWGTDYRIPIGEDLGRNGSNQRGGFTIVGLNVQAVKNNTNVQIDLDGNGTFETTSTLNQGEHFNAIQGVRTGARVQASAEHPVQVHLFFADPTQTYEARGSTMVPFDQWTNDYLAPRSSDGDFWLYNPNGTDLQVKAETITSTTIITIPANSTAKFPPVGLSGITGTRFSSTGGNFFGVAALDAADAQDWGHALLPFNRLTPQTLIGLGIGNYNIPPDGDQSPVYVTAVTTTTLFADYDNDGTADRSFPIFPLSETRITDPDHDLTGAFLFTNDDTPFASVWGQDQTAPPALPSIDVGSGIVPLPSLDLQKTFRPKQDSDCSGTLTRGDTIQFKLQYFNNTVNPIRNVIIADTLPSQVTYQPHTTLLNGALISDDSSGTTPFPLDEGGYKVGDVDRLASGTLTFDVVINDDSNPRIENRADVSLEDLSLGSHFVIVVITTQPTSPLLEINKALIDPTDGIVTNGQTITFGLTITNTSNSTMTALQLQDTFNENHLTFLNAGPPPDLVASGVITWDDLTSTFGDLLPGATIRTTVSFAAGQLFPTITNTVNAVVVEARRSNTPAPLTCSASALVEIFPPPEPAIHVKKSTNGFDADDPNNDPVPQIKPGDPVTWDYVVTNIGNVPLANVTLVDDQLALLGVTPSFVSGDTDNDGRLDLDETWVYRATGVAEDLPNSNRPRGQCGPGGFEAPLYTNMATASGEFGPTTVIDDDPSHYCPPPDNGNGGGCQGDCTPPTPPPPPPPVVQAPTPTPLLPVVFLPETGYRESQVAATKGGFAWLGLALLGISAAALWLRCKT